MGLTFELRNCDLLCFCSRPEPAHVFGKQVTVPTSLGASFASVLWYQTFRKLGNDWRTGRVRNGMYLCTLQGKWLPYMKSTKIPYTH